MRKVADLLYVPQGAYVHAKARARDAAGLAAGDPLIPARRLTGSGARRSRCAIHTVAALITAPPRSVASLGASPNSVQPSRVAQISSRNLTD